MTQRAVRSYKSGKHLLKRLSNNPALPAFVKTLDTTTFSKVIQEIGIEDSALLVELSSPDQMVALVDSSVWHNDLPGAPVTFQGEEFLRWLEVMLEIGDEFCSQRLLALGDDLLATAFSHFLDVGGPGDEIASSAEAAELYGPFVVRPKDDDQWDVLYAMLGALQEDAPDLLQTMLLRCCLPEGHTRGANTAEMDATFEHERGREKQGFVTPQIAEAFLANARTSVLTDLAEEADYDLETARYFRSVERNHNPPSSEATPRQESDLEDEPPIDDDALTSTEDDMADLELTVREIELLDRVDQPTLLLMGPATSSKQTALQGALAELREAHPYRTAQRLAEGAYLSNVLMSGTTVAGKRFSEAEAAAAVAATCNLGLDYLAEADLSKEPGLIRLFRIGWHILQTLPLDTARKLVMLAESVDASASLRGWMVTEINELLSRDEFFKDIGRGSFDDVHETLEMLALIITEEHAAELAALINDTPRLLVETAGVQEVVDRQRRFIETLDDLDQIDLLMAGLKKDFSEL